MLAERIAPARILAAGSVVAVALALADVWFACSVPWLGVRFDAPRAGEGIVVARVFDKGPAAGVLVPGDVVTAIERQDGGSVPLSRATISPSTDSLSTYAAVDQLLDDHRALWRAITQEQVVIVRADGGRAVLRPHPRRDLASLPLQFWAMTLVTIVALPIGVGVFAFRPAEEATRMLLIACLGLAVAAPILAFGTGRELTFPASWVQPGRATEQLGELMAQFGILGLLWVYPRRFRPSRYLWAVAALFVAAWLAGRYEWWPSPRATVPLTTSAVYFLGLVPLSTWQWRAARSDPVDRTVLKILLPSILVPLGALVIANRVPSLLGLPPAIPRGVGGAVALLVLYVGLALGVARYRLFNLGRWWFEALAWGLGGALVVLFDTALLWLNASAGVALGGAVALAGWLYFPLRQWLWRRLSPAARQSVERHLPRLIESLFSADSSAAVQANWRRLLEQIYAPLAIHDAATAIADVAVARDGLVLRVPALAAAPPLELHHADKGRRLFTSADAAVARSLLALTQQAVRARRAQDERAAEQRARLRERELLLQDLHDGLGGMATNIGLLAARARQEEDAAAMQSRLATIGELAEASLAEIRGFMYSLDESDSDWPAVAADLRAYGRKLVEPHGLEFAMAATIAESVSPADSLMRLDIGRIYKEALMNVVKHARAQRVTVRLDVAMPALELVVEDDGVGIAARAPGTRSRGLGNLVRSAERLGGSVAVAARDDGPGTAVRLHVPLPAKTPGAGDAAASAAP